MEMEKGTETERGMEKGTEAEETGTGTEAGETGTGTETEMGTETETETEEGRQEVLFEHFGVPDLKLR